MSHGRDVRISNRRNGEWGTSGAGSGDGREGSGKRVPRAAVTGERKSGKVGKAWRTMRHRVLDAVFIVCPKFLFLKNNDDGDVSRPIVVGLSV